MGLDMYLRYGHYVNRYEYPLVNNQIQQVESLTFQNIIDQLDLRHYTDDSGSAAGIQVNIPIGYWRKANAIHGWFVRNVAEGVDDCKELYVPMDKLEELLDICKQVKADPSKANELLPPTSGFFFGGGEIDEYYLQDIDYTIDLLTKVVNDDMVCNDIYYEASW